MIFETTTQLNDFMRDAPGPSPWYLVGNNLQFEGFKTEWLSGDNYIKAQVIPIKNAYTGTTILSLNGEVKLIFYFQCYVLKHSDNQIVIWYEQTDEKSNSDLKIKVVLMDVTKLKTISNLNAIAQSLNQNTKIGWQGEGLISEFEFSKNQGIGTHSIEVSDPIKHINEILFFARANALPSESNASRTAIYKVDFAKGFLTTVPQEWYNKGDFDFGYEWPTRVKREPVSGRVYGSGIRMRSFLLSDDLRTIDRWYSQ